MPEDGHMLLGKVRVIYFAFLPFGLVILSRNSGITTTTADFALQLLMNSWMLCLSINSSARKQRKSYSWRLPSQWHIFFHFTVFHLRLIFSATDCRWRERLVDVNEAVGDPHPLR